MMFDLNYLLYVFLPLLALTGLTHLWVKAAYARASQIGNRQGVTGAEAAELILRQAGIFDVRVEPVAGFLSDHYSPREKVLRLSPKNFHESSIAAVGIAAHEAGHAIQHARKYAPLALRNAAVPLASIGSGMGYFVIFIGLLMASRYGSPINLFSVLGLCMYGAVAVFQLVNLPVEFDASRRALQVLPQTGILSLEETREARHVLTAAAMTYVAATVAALWELVYWAMRLGIIGGGRSDDR